MEPSDPPNTKKVIQYLPSQTLAPNAMRVKKHQKEQGIIDSKEENDSQELEEPYSGEKIVQFTVQPEAQHNGLFLAEKKDKTPHKRVACKKWFIQPEMLTQPFQSSIIQMEDAAICQQYPLVKQQLELKLYSYRQQDIKKNLYEEGAFITLSDTLSLLRECNLVCAYCNECVFVLYENVRDPKQWSLDRIDNDAGHNKGNVMIACLQCNLKRRRINMSSFLFTKQMKLVKV